MQVEFYMSYVTTKISMFFERDGALCGVCVCVCVLVCFAATKTKANWGSIRSSFSREL